MNSATLSILAASAPGPMAALMQSQLPLIVGMGLIFYFFLVRPQMQQQKAQRAKIAGLKRGDQVVTAGGLLGKVVKVDETQVELELAPNVKVRALRSTISDVVQPSGAPAND